MILGNGLVKQLAQHQCLDLNFGAGIQDSTVLLYMISTSRMCLYFLVFLLSPNPRPLSPRGKATNHHKPVTLYSYLFGFLPSLWQNSYLVNRVIWVFFVSFCLFYFLSINTLVI